jgi:diadenosine tetraphosphate (Ap4A) HIT family hydrolase
MPTQRARLAGMSGVGDEVGQRVAWDVDAYVTRVREACFVCAMLAGADGYEHHVIHRDETVVVFLAKYPNLWGHVLVAPVAHREQVITDFTEDEYAELQRLIHRVGRALTSVIETERLYVTSLGSQQGNTHVHWHLLPLPPGVPYEDQQMAVFDTDKGWLQVTDADMAELAADVRTAMATA